jgi:hypothetical protein
MENQQNKAEIRGTIAGLNFAVCFRLRVRKGLSEVWLQRHNLQSISQDSVRPNFTFSSLPSIASSQGVRKFAK